MGTVYRSLIRMGTILFKVWTKRHGDGQFRVPYGIDVDNEGTFGLLIEEITGYKSLIVNGNFVFNLATIIAMRQG